MNPEMIESIQAERAKAQAIVDACDAFLAVFPGAPVAVAIAKVARTPKVPQTPHEPRVTSPAKQAAASASGEPSKVGRYADTILKILAHHSREPHRSADSTVIRREVAKACGVDPAKDGSFPGDVSNALQKLKAQGKVERSGTVWALVRPRES